MLPVRIQSIRNRSEELGASYESIVKRIAMFKSVEGFQSWKNGLDNTTAYIVKRIGGNNYRYLRDNIHHVLNIWAKY